MDKRFWAIIGVIVVVFVGVVALRGGDENTGSSKAEPTNHVIGKLDSKVTLMEYGDFQCPVCEGYYPTVQQVQQKYKDTVKFQFRHLPLVEVHNNALAASRAAEAAGKQDKFWEMYDSLYTQANWAEWSRSSNAPTYFEQYANTIGLNMTQYKKDFGSSAVNNNIQADVAAFKKTGQEKSTPTFFVNGKYVSNSKLVDANKIPSVEAFSKALDEALKEAEKQQ